MKAMLEEYGSAIVVIVLSSFIIWLLSTLLSDIYSGRMFEAFNQEWYNSGAYEGD